MNPADPASFPGDGSGGCAGTCPGDLHGSADTGIADLLAVLSDWGPGGACPKDIDASGDVDFPDLLIILSTWGPCGL